MNEMAVIELASKVNSIGNKVPIVSRISGFPTFHEIFDKCEYFNGPHLYMSEHLGLHVLHIRTSFIHADLIEGDVFGGAFGGCYDDAERDMIFELISALLFRFRSIAQQNVVHDGVLVDFFDTYDNNYRITTSDSEKPKSMQNDKDQR